MSSKIYEIMQNYSKLPDELIKTDISEALAILKNEIKSMIDADVRNMRELAVRRNKIIAFNELTKPATIIKMALYTKDDNQNDILENQESFYYAHWMMSLASLQYLSNAVIKSSTELKSLYISYVNDNTQDKRTSFNHFIRTFQEFYGYLLNMRNVIIQYHDRFVQTYNKIDPESKKETIIAYKSGICHEQLLEAAKELLLHGNVGRLCGFVLLRSAIKIFVTRELFEVKKSQKYNKHNIIFLKKRIPTLSTICKSIEKLNMSI